MDVETNSISADVNRGGVDSEGQTYASIEEMWTSQGIRTESAARRATKRLLVAPPASSSYGTDGDISSAAGASSNEPLAGSSTDADARLGREAVSRWYQTGAAFWSVRPLRGVHYVKHIVSVTSSSDLPT